MRARWRPVALVVAVAILAMLPAFDLDAAVPDGATGALDPTFDDDGIALAAMGGAARTLDTDRQRLADGTERIVALVLQHSTPTLWALTPDGAFDLGFGAAGAVRVDARVPAQRVAVGDDGAILVAGWNSAQEQVGIARYLPDGQPDVGFGSFGVATVADDGGDPPDVIFRDFSDLDVQSDGSVVVVGPGTHVRDEETETAVALARLAPNGNVVRVTAAAFDPHVPSISPHSVAVHDGDGVRDRVAVSVSALTDDGNVHAFRFLSDLEPDPSFGGDGIASAFVSGFQPDDPRRRLPVVAGADGGVAIAAETPWLPEPDGADVPPRWVVVAWGPTGASTVTGAASFTEAETDTTIGGLAATVAGGFAVVGTIPFSSGPDAVGVAVFVPADGFAVERQVIEHPGPAWTDVRGVGLVRLDDDTFRVVGDALVEVSFNEVPDRRVLVARLDGGGAFDDGYGPEDDGFALLTGGGFVEGTSVVVQPDRKVLVGGGGGPREGFVLRYLEDGRLDPTFGEGGISILDLEVLDVALDQQDGGIAVVGAIDGAFGAVQRLTADGQPDPDFNDGDWQDNDGFSTALRGVTIDDDQRIVVVGDIRGFLNGLPQGQILVARFLRDGSPDPGFGGVAGEFPGTTRIGRGPEIQDSAFRAFGRDVAVQGDGHVVVTGELDRRLALARVDDEGVMDPAFGDGHPVWGDGIVQEDVAGLLGAVDGGDSAGWSIAVDDATGDLVVAGDVSAFGGFGDTDEDIYSFVHTAMVARYRPDGRRAAGFGLDVDGDADRDGVALPVPLVAETPDGPASLLSEARGVAIDDFGSIVVGGSIFGESVVDAAVATAALVAEPPEDDDVFVARLLPAGESDPTFGEDGLVLTDVGAGEAGADLGLAPDAKILVAGRHDGARGRLTLTARYLVNHGRLDCTPATLRFGRVRVRRPTTSLITCVAVDAPVTVTAVTVAPDSPHAGDFSIPDEFCTGVDGALAVGEVCQIPVTFTPRADGGRSATLVVDYRSPHGPARVGLSGTGLGTRVDPEILVRRFTASPDPVRFAEQLVGTTSASRRVTVRNDGNVAFSIRSVTVGGAHLSDFRVVATSCAGVTLAPDATCTVDVVFEPTAADPGERLGVLRFDTDLPGGPRVVVLRGAAIPALLTLEPAEGPIGTEFTATGEGYQPGVAVDLDVLGEPLGSVPGDAVDADGRFTVALTVPEGIPGGPQPVTACQRCGGVLELGASAPFTVTPRLFVAPEVVRTGRVAMATGDGFPAGTPVTLRWQPGLGITTTRADDTGRIRQQVLVFRRDLVGQRELQASISGASEVVASAEALVVLGTVQPGDFAVRR